MAHSLRYLGVCAALVVAAALKTTDTRFLVWPPAKDIRADGSAVAVEPGFSFALSDESAALSPPTAARLQRALLRFTSLTEQLMADGNSGLASPASAGITRADLVIHSDNLELSGRTDYSYSLRIMPGNPVATVEANTIYGGMNGMESFVQLMERSNGSVTIPFDDISIQDAPLYAWRGLMVDAGRRFFPVPVLENLLDTMAANKMSVLHLHASDMCRFGVESKQYPNLTNALTGELAGFYTQADIANIIAYAGDRGVRVVAEFDVPGHSRGFIPITNAGVEFCEPTDPTRSQLYGDPANSTYGVLTKLFTEMASLFTDEVFHLGCDETAALGPCTVSSTFALERQLINYVANNLGKKPAGWEEILFDAGAATPSTIVFSWARHSPAEVTATGRQVVVSNSSHFYFTQAAPGGPSGWAPTWFDISTGVPTSQQSLIQGGEVSQWTDTYCYTAQCGASNGPTPYASQLFGPQYDDVFGLSIGGNIWPRGYVAAAAFWNYNTSVSSSDPAFVSAIWALNDQLAARGSWVCPTNCSCDQLSSCGVPYVKPTPPPDGTPVYAQPCQAGIAATQKWVFNADGTIALALNTSICLQDPGAGTYPLVIGPCDANTAKWRHDATTAEVIQTATGFCLDLSKTSGAIGTYECTSGDGVLQTNQEWAVDPAAGVVVSFYNGSCVTAAAQP